MHAPRVIMNAARLGQPWAGIPGIERSSAGRLFVTCFSGGEKEPTPDNRVYLSISDDGGGTFGTPVVMAPPRDGGRAFDPALWIDPLGRLWLLFNRAHKERGEHGVFARLCEQPDAAEAVFGEEFRVGYDVPFCFRLNKPTVLTTGEWVMPVTHAPQSGGDWFPKQGQLQGVGISRDQGQSWTLHGAVEAPHWALENMIVERRDGSLVMFIRATGGVLWQSVSADRGLTWSPGKPTAIVNPGTRFFVRALPGGDWLLINTPDPKKRTGLVASLSSDEGATWHGALDIDARENVSYPDAVRTEDGSFLVVYDRDRQGAGEILLQRFNQDDIR